MAENTNKTKIVFMGSSAFAVPILEELNEKFTVVAVVTESDKQSGRGRKTVFSSVKICALNKNLPILQPEFLKKNETFINEIKTLNPDLIVVVAYGKILPSEILNLPKHGCLNIHPSLLPKYRGPSPIQSALLHNEKITGVSIILMDVGMDTGDIVYSEDIEIETKDNFTTLSQKLSELSAEIMIRIIPDYLQGELPLVIQSENEATYCQKIEKIAGEIDWQKPVAKIVNQVRAFVEWPGSYTFFLNKKIDLTEVEEYFPASDIAGLRVGQVLRIENQIIVKCGEGYLQINKLKMEGKKEVPAKDFLNGYAQFGGSILGRN
ncbi:MAG: methionyl-tRNA formyltransferase [Patescibacteria group bacterium]